MSKKADFFVYLLEHYAVYKNTTADKILTELEEKKLTEFVYDMYEMYHTEAITNAFEDLDALIATGKTAW